MSSVRPWMKVMLWSVMGLTTTGWVWRSMNPVEADDPTGLVAELADRKSGAPKAQPVTAYSSEPDHAVRDLDPGHVVRLSSSSAPVDIFRSHRWFVQPPPPPPPPPMPAAQPVVIPQPVSPPPPPFVIIGRMDEGTDGLKVFINYRESMQVVGVGDVIDATYRIDDITANAMRLTNLPTQQAVTLPIPGVSR